MNNNSLIENARGATQYELKSGPSVSSAQQQTTNPRINLNGKHFFFSPPVQSHFMSPDLVASLIQQK